MSFLFFWHLWYLCTVWGPPGLRHCKLRCEERMWPSPGSTLWLCPPQQQCHEDRSHLWVRRMFLCRNLNIILQYLSLLLCSVSCADIALISVFYGFIKWYFILKDLKTHNSCVFRFLSSWFQTGFGLRWLKQRRCPFSASPCHGGLQIQHGGMDVCFPLEQ